MELHNGFDWRPVPDGRRGERFWQRWRDDKAAMLANGYRVKRVCKAGVWLVCRLPPGLGR